MSELVLSERDGALHILTLNRPDRHNAMDDAMSALFRTRLDDALEESESSAILIRAAGKSFCSGRDTQVLGPRARDASAFHFVRRHQAGRSAARRFGKECVSPCRSRWSPAPTNNKLQTHI